MYIQIYIYIYVSKYKYTYMYIYISVTGHNINFDDTEIIAEEKCYWRRLIIEGLEIKILGENRANRNTGFEIHECWDPILEKLKP